MLRLSNPYSCQHVPQPRVSAMRRDLSAVVLDAFRNLTSVNFSSLIWVLFLLASSGYWYVDCHTDRYGKHIASGEWLACFCFGRSDVYIAVLMKIQVSWVMTPCRLVNRDCLCWRRGCLHVLKPTRQFFMCHKDSNLHPAFCDMFCKPCHISFSVLFLNALYNVSSILLYQGVTQLPTFLSWYYMYLPIGKCWDSVFI
jgi:hypothetical protein